MSEKVFDVLVVGAGPTGISVGCEALRAGLSVLICERGVLTNSFIHYPTYLTFFTTRDRMEIAGIPMSIPQEKANRQQALAYYRAVVAAYKLPISLHEEVLAAERGADGFRVKTRRFGQEIERQARHVVVATGYFDNPRHLGIPGEEFPWVSTYYREPYPHYGEHVLIIGGGNSACKTALDLWRNGAQVTMAVRAPAFREGVKYWILPDIQNRVAEGSITAHFETVATKFQEDPRGTVLQKGDGSTFFLSCAACYIQVGYIPDVSVLRNSGVSVHEETLVPQFKSSTCETNIPGLYVAGTIQSGLDTSAVFIDNSRDHGAKIIQDVARKLGR